MSLLSALVLLFAAVSGKAYSCIRTNRRDIGIWKRPQAAATTTFENDLLALDFDGVICDSSPESSVSAIRAIQNLWGFRTSDEEFETVKNIVMALRPIVETGYENLLLARLVLEEIRLSGDFDTDTMLRIWCPDLRDSLIEKYGENKEKLIAAFGDTRDYFIANEFRTWLDLNQLYPGIQDSFQILQQSEFQLDNFFIITTKQERFVIEILKSEDLVVPGKENLYGLGNKLGSKVDVLLSLAHNRLKKGHKIHFIEDKVETLLQIASTPGLEMVDLYLVDWGYTTLQQRMLAEDHERVEIIDSAQFKKICEAFLKTNGT